MTEIPVEQLEPNAPLPSPLYHRTGTILFPAGHLLLPAQIEALAAAKISSLHLIEEPADVARLKKRTGLHSILLSVLKLNAPLPHDICNEQATVLLSRNQIFEIKHRDALTRTNITHVYVPSAESLRELDAYAYHLARHAADALDRDLAPVADRAPLSPGQQPFLASVSRIIDRSPEARARANSLRAAAGNEAQALLSSLRETSTVRTDIPGIVETVVEGFSHDANFLLKLASVVAQQGQDHDPRADHLINVCLHSLAIGAYLNYSEAQLKHLGACAFLHDIGMVRVPTEILVKPGPLLPMERLEVERHTIHALNLLDRIPSVDAAMFLPVYQSHERLDGSGYPKGRRPPFIHEFARVIAIADTYAAMSSPRPYRPAKLPHDAMAATINLAASNALDKTILRAFLYAVGLFPIGSWVRLSTGLTGRVISTGKDPARYDRPTLSIICAADQSPISPPQTLHLSDHPDVTVTQVLPPDALAQNPDVGF